MFPENATTKHYLDLFDLEKSNYILWYINSMKISIITMVLSVITVSLTGYAFSRYRFIGRKNGLLTFLVLQMIPNFAALIAIFVLAQRTGLIDTHLGLILNLCWWTNSDEHLADERVLGHHSKGFG